MFLYGKKDVLTGQLALLQVVGWSVVLREKQPTETTVASGESFLDKAKSLKRTWNVEKRHPFYLNILNVSRRNIHCTLMVKRYEFITSYKNYIKSDLVHSIVPSPIAK